MANAGERPLAVLVIQTAFLGDVILTLPLLQALKKIHPESTIDFVVAPRGADAARNHPAIHRLIVYDKKGKDAGLSGFVRVARLLREGNYDAAIIPHRSLRSAALAVAARVPRRIGFDRSAGRLVLTAVVPYREDSHEYRRNLDLLSGLGEAWNSVEYPRIYPSATDVSVVEKFLDTQLWESTPLVGIAPGTIWNTKRWMPERFAAVARSLAAQGCFVVLIGGADDKKLCDDIVAETGGKGIVSTAGMFNVLQSGELIRRCKVLVCNDSAPLHLAAAVGTPVVAIFGATVPRFGFGPYGKNDLIIEKEGLACRPCSIHGTKACPIGTFECMESITAGVVANNTLNLLRNLAARNP